MQRLLITSLTFMLDWVPEPVCQTYTRARLLDIAVGVIHRFGHPVGADREVDQRSLRLRAPILVGGHLNRAHRVGVPPGATGVMPIGMFRIVGASTVPIVIAFVVFGLPHRGGDGVDPPAATAGRCG
jgi:hypothetical protein